MNTRFRILALSLLFAPAAFPGASAGPILEHYVPSFGLLRDTVHVLDSTFLEVRLNEQAIYQHFRSGRVVRYTCSSGDPRIKDGIATREGIYSIQWKAKKHMSEQFQCYLNYWMPFDGGIGFHGLQGRSYYRFLGRRPSSHGCVRIANESGQKIFRDAPRGTVVWVHYGSPARILRFGDSTSGDMTIMQTVDIDLLNARLDAVLARRTDDTSLARRIALRPGKPFSARIAVGRIDRQNRANWPLDLVRPATATIVRRTENPAAARPISGPDLELSLLVEN